MFPKFAYDEREGSTLALLVASKRERMPKTVFKTLVPKEVDG